MLAHDYTHSGRGGPDTTRVPSWPGTPSSSDSSSSTNGSLAPASAAEYAGRTTIGTDS